MANQYIDASYVDAYLGSNVRGALFTDSGSVYCETNFNTLATAASSVVETALRNSGYETPTGTILDLSLVPEYVKLATFGVFLEMASARAEHRLKLPEDWANSQFKQAYQAILSGDAALSLTISESAAIGGITFSETDDTITSTDGSRPHIFSRKGMTGY